MSTEKKHHKHADLAKPSLGQFARYEFAVYGTSCSEVKLFTDKIRSLFPDVSIAFADADHQEEPEPVNGTHWQDKINAIQVTSTEKDNVYSRRMALNDASLVVVNGNHFIANAQVIVCNPEKEKSLLKRADQLTNVVAVFTTSENQIPDYVQQLLPQGHQIPVMQIQDDQIVSSWIRNTFLEPAPLHALILTGGKSVRMGRDKALIQYHNEPQYQHVYHLLEGMGIMPFISCREEQREFFEDHGCRTITDRINGLGPMGGMISAFMKNPDHAWLVLACDLPLLDGNVIQQLISNRKSTAIATSFQSPHDKFPEPLVAIWEPASYPRIMQFVAQGISCPRKVLINSNTHVIHASDAEKLTNVNTPDDLEDVFPEMMG